MGFTGMGFSGSVANAAIGRSLNLALLGAGGGLDTPVKLPGEQHQRWHRPIHTSQSTPVLADC